MQELIDDLLKLSRVTTLTHDFVPVDLDDVMRQVAGDLEVAIHEASADVRIDELPTIDADPLQMRQLLQNLLSNAVKFRREGIAPSIHVSGRVHAGVAEILIDDNGIGFDPQHAARIFGVFERLHPRAAYPGTGIGLALCRKITHRHGGSITADSKPGIGSRFKVTLSARHDVDVANAHPARDPAAIEPEPVDRMA
jgi:light-regulated signal transduction histidine kinase (bacteriophytochrome)